MPGHFTHIYSARRVADLLASGKFEDWPQRNDPHTNAHRMYHPTFCGEIMKKWEKFTAIGGYLLFSFTLLVSRMMNVATDMNPVFLCSQNHSFTLLRDFYLQSKQSELTEKSVHFDKKEKCK